MDSVVEFLLSETKGLIIVGTTILVLIIILGKLGFRIIKNLIKSAFFGAIVFAMLYFIVGLSIETVGIIGIVVFLLTAIFGKISTGK